MRKDQPLDIFSGVILTENTYAAAAPRGANLLATVPTDNKTTNSTTNAKITPSLGLPGRLMSTTEQQV